MTPLPQPIVIKPTYWWLSRRDFCNAVIVGTGRQIVAGERDLEGHQSGGEPERNFWDQLRAHVSGAVGEMVIARFVDQKFAPLIGTVGQPDFPPNVDVKSISWDRKRDDFYINMTCNVESFHADWRYIHVLPTLTLNCYLIVGEMTGDEIEQRYKPRGEGYRQYYLVPYPDLSGGRAYPGPERTTFDA